MEYRAVNNRCAVNIASLRLPVSNQEAIKILSNKGFRIVEVDIIALARSCIKTSTYIRGAKPSEAPMIVDCSSFVKWLYGQCGIWLPRLSIQQRELGVSTPIDKVIAGDVVFVSGCIDYYQTDPGDGVGHVGIVTGEGTIIHAVNRKTRVTESSLEGFIGKSKFRGVKRYIPKDQVVFTFEIPPNREVETENDFRWIVLQSLPKR